MANISGRRAEIMDREENILPVFLRDVEGRAVQILARDRQRLERGEDVTPDFFQLLGVVAADIEYTGPLLLREGVETHGHQHHLAGAAGSLEQTMGIGIEPRRCRSVDIADMLGVVVVRGGACRVILDVGRLERALFQTLQDIFGGRTQSDAEVVDQMKVAVLVEPREQGELGIGGTPVDESAAGIIADAPEDGRADTGRTDHGMGLASEQPQRLLQLEERGALKPSTLRASPRQTRYRIRVLLFFTYDRKIARVAAMNASRMTLSASPCVIRGRTSASVRMTGWKYVMDGLPDPICPRTDHTQVGASA